MKKTVKIVALITLLGFNFGCSQKSITLKDVFVKDLDADLQEKLAESRKIALTWQDDARLFAVRLNMHDEGEISWRFHWISNSGKNYIALFSNTTSVRQTGDDPDVEEKPYLDIQATIGFNKVEEILEAEGMELEGIKIEDVLDLKLSHERKWEIPPAFYYYIFLRDGSQYWIHSETGELKR